MHIRVDIMLKAGVLDIEGKAIENSLSSNFHGISNLKQGKVIEFDLAGDDKEMALEQVKKMCEFLLANITIEDYKITIV